MWRWFQLETIPQGDKLTDAARGLAIASEEFALRRSPPAYNKVRAYMLAIADEMCGTIELEFLECQRESVLNSAQQVLQAASALEEAGRQIVLTGAFQIVAQIYLMVAESCWHTIQAKKAWEAEHGDSYLDAPPPDDDQPDSGPPTDDHG